MKIVDIKNETITIELDRFHAFRLARMLESPSDSDDDIEFAEVYASLLKTAGMVADQHANGFVYARSGVYPTIEEIEDSVKPTRFRLAS